MSMRILQGRSMVIFAAVMLLFTVGWQGAARAGDDLTELLTEVGGDYAEAYLSTLVNAFGANQLSNLYSSAAIETERLRISVGLKFINTKLAEEDDYFRRVTEVTLDETFGLSLGDPGFGSTGFIDMTGPTVFGPDDDEDVGQIQAYFEGLPVGTPIKGIESLWKSQNVPLAVPEISAEGIAGLRATLRYMPTVSIKDIPDVKLYGFGLQYNVNQHFPQWPVDVMVGFFIQSLNVGDSVETSANSFYLAASKTYAPATFYGGIAAESSSMDVAYTQVIEDINGNPIGEADISFSLDGEQSTRFTLGALLNLGMPMLNVEAGIGTMNTLSAGLMFGF